MDGYSIDINGKKEIIKQGSKEVYCHNNQLTELNLPDGVRVVYCWGNQLTELILPDGVKWVSCDNNQITELILPDGVKSVFCDKTVLIKNLDKFIGKEDITIRFL